MASTTTPAWKKWQRPQMAALLLRLGLAFVFGYAAIAAFREPAAWVSFVPSFVGTVIDPKLALDLLSVGQLVLAAWLLSGVYLTAAALVSFVFLAGVTVGNPGALLITFRDVALAVVALALACLDTPSRR